MNSTTNSTTKIIEARTLRGFRDELPGERLIKEQMLEKLRAVFQSFGYVPIETPHLEYFDVLTGNEDGGEISKQIFHFTDQGGREVGLRFDLTVPFARFVVQHRHELGLPFKRYAIGSAFRGERPQAGRYREFTQCDFDIVGTTAPGADAEIIQVIAAALTALEVPSFLIRINSRAIMNGFAEMHGVGHKSSVILRVLDKLDKIGIDEVRKLLIEEAALNDSVAGALIDLVSLSRVDSGAELFSRVNTACEGNALARSGVERLREIFKILEASGVPSNQYCFDLSIARGLGYYTGVVCETILSDLPGIGSVCGGGRYDNLTMTFSKEPCPGVGASVGLDRILAAFAELKLLPLRKTAALVLFVQERAEESAIVHHGAAKLRALGIPVEVYPEAAKMKKQFEYAERHGHPFLVFVKDGGARYLLRQAISREEESFSNLSLLGQRVCTKVKG